MATGLVDNWVNIDTFGAIYPFPGSEFLLAILGIVFWLGWHVYQLKEEAAEFKEDQERIARRGGVGAVLDEEISRETSDLSGG